VAETEVAGPEVERGDEVLTAEAVEFVADLHRRFDARRTELLARRARRRAEIAAAGRLDWLPETKEVREARWSVPPPPPDLADRRTEITGPTERKMAINALNSGARVWLADHEDANAPTWANMVAGQVNLIDAIERRIRLDSPDGKEYALTSERIPAIVFRPRGWHLTERHLRVDGQPVSASLFDVGLYVFHNAARQVARGSGPYLYLPKLESHLEARLWNEVFIYTQQSLELPRGTIRATVLIETITAVFEMDEILHELGEHAAGLNAGRWDYLFSVIKNFRDSGPEFVLPDRNSVTMTAPFMRAYTELLVQTCHRRGAMAIGGMAAFVPSRREPEVTERALAEVRQDKEREARDGFDGSWVAHPDLVPVCTEVFDTVLGDRPNQLDRQRPDVAVTADALLDVRSTPGEATETGLRSAVDVGLQYIESWLRGVGAAAIHNLMEDAATAEISRSQVWQWLHGGVTLADAGQRVTPELVRRVITEQLDGLREQLGAEAFDAGRWRDARELFEQVALADEFVDFLTLPAYERID
jgi:malate synthase